MIDKRTHSSCTLTTATKSPVLRLQSTTQNNCCALAVGCTLDRPDVWRTLVRPRGNVRISKWSAQADPPSPSRDWFPCGHTSATDPVRRHSSLTRTTGLLKCLLVTY